MQFGMGEEQILLIEAMCTSPALTGDVFNRHDTRVCLCYPNSTEWPYQHVLGQLTLLLHGYTYTGPTQLHV